MEHASSDRPASVQAEPLSAITIRVTTPDAARQGMIDILTMRPLVRAVRSIFGHNRQDDFDHALAKMINLSGAMAQVIERERGRQK